MFKAPFFFLQAKSDLFKVIEPYGSFKGTPAMAVGGWALKLSQQQTIKSKNNSSPQKGIFVVHLLLAKLLDDSMHRPLEVVTSNNYGQ